MQRTMRHSLREAIEVVMDSVFPPLFRRGMRLALPAFLLICLEFWPVSGAGAASRTADALSPAPSTPPTQGAARAPVLPACSAFTSLTPWDKSLTPMLCRPEDPAIPAAKEGRLGIRTGTALRCFPCARICTSRKKRPGRAAFSRDKHRLCPRTGPFSRIACPFPGSGRPRSEHTGKTHCAGSDGA